MNSVIQQGNDRVFDQALPPGGQYYFKAHSAKSHQLEFIDNNGVEYAVPNIWYNRVLTASYLDTVLASKERESGFLQLLLENEDFTIDRQFAADYLSKTHGGYYQAHDGDPITKLERAYYPDRYYGNKTFSLQASVVQKTLQDSGLFEFTATSSNVEHKFFLSAYDLEGSIFFNHDLIVNNHFDAIEPLFFLEACRALYRISRIEISNMGMGWAIKSTNLRVQEHIDKWLQKHVNYWEINNIAKPCDVHFRDPSIKSNNPEKLS